MKISYTKVYIPEILAHANCLSPQQIGESLVGVCEQAFFGHTAYAPKTHAETVLFEMLTEWKEECVRSLKQKHAAGRKGGKASHRKQEKLDGSTASPSALSTPLKQLELEQELELEPKPETETETENIFLTAQSKIAQGVCENSSQAGQGLICYNTCKEAQL